MNLRGLEGGGGHEHSWHLRRRAVPACTYPKTTDRRHQATPVRGSACKQSRKEACAEPSFREGVEKMPTEGLPSPGTWTIWCSLKGRGRLAENYLVSLIV